MTIIRNTTIIQNNYVRNNVRYVSGPRVNDIQRVTRQRVNVYTVGADNRPGATRITNNSVNVYRPRVSRVNNTLNNPAPSRVVRNGETLVNNNQPNASGMATRSRGERDDRQSVRRPGSSEERVAGSGDRNMERPATPGNAGRSRPERIMRTDRSTETGSSEQRVVREQQNQERSRQLQERDRRARSESRVRNEPQRPQRNQQMQERGQQRQTERQRAPERRMDRQQPRTERSARPQRG